MDNFQLMRILQQLSLSNRNKKLALFFGAATVVGISAAVYWHKKNNAAQKENKKLNYLNLSLMQEKDYYADSINKLKKEISNQSIVIRKYADKSLSPEKKEEGKV